MASNLPKEWFCVANGKRLGPFTLEEMIKLAQSNSITSDSLVWHKKLGDWKKAGETLLKTFFRSPPSAPPRPAPSSPPRPSSPSPRSYAPPHNPPAVQAKRSGKMKYIILGIIAAAILGGGGYYYVERSAKNVRMHILRGLNSEILGSAKRLAGGEGAGIAKYRNDKATMAVAMAVSRRVIGDGGFGCSKGNLDSLAISSDGSLLLRFNEGAKNGYCSLTYSNNIWECGCLGNKLSEREVPEMCRNAVNLAVEKEVEEINALEEKAKKGEREAQFNLAVRYYNGKGVAMDKKQALHWYEKAGEQGLAEAQFNAGLMYYNGENVLQDYKKAANQGLKEAQSALGVMYRKGEGVTKDIKKAREWYKKAADQGDEVAIKNLRILESEYPETVQAEQPQSQEQDQTQESTSETQGQENTQSTGADNSPLTDSEYRNMLATSDEFRKADGLLNDTWKKLISHPGFQGKGYTEDQRQWIRTGRDQSARQFIGSGYDRISAYTQATIMRTKELNGILNELNSNGANTTIPSNAKVVIDGTGVRMRFGPSLNTDWLKWENGATRAPNKGERLRYLGSEGDWYIVEYVGRRFYVSKEYSHLEY